MDIHEALERFGERYILSFYYLKTRSQTPLSFFSGSLKCREEPEETFPEHCEPHFLGFRDAFRGKDPHHETAEYVAGYELGSRTRTDLIRLSQD